MQTSQLYTKLREVAQAKMPYLAYIDLQKQQMIKASDTYAIPFPAILFEFKQASYSEVLKHCQLGRIKVRVYLYVKLSTDTFDATVQEAESLDFLGKIEDVFQTFEGIKCAPFTELTRERERIVTRYGTKYICFRTDFATSIKEIKEVTELTTPTPAIKITGVTGLDKLVS